MNVFLSYRRNDSAILAHHLKDKLEAAAGIQEVFLDVYSIEAGEPFHEAIQETLQKSDIVLVLMGERWEGPRGDGEPPRIWEDDDYLRNEIQQALASDSRVVPVLIDRTIPEPETLPDTLRELVDLQVFSLRSNALPRDIRALIHSIAPLRGIPSVLRLVGLSLLGVLLAAAALFLLATLNNVVTGDDLATTLGGLPAVVGVVVTALLVGLAAPWVSLVRGA